MDSASDTLINEIVNKLRLIPGVKAIVLGGSRADDTHRPDSDFDIGIYYRDPSSFSVRDIKQLAHDINDTPNPTVTSIGGWGKWVNGGAWLVVRGQRVDFIYRDWNFVAQIIQDCKKGLRQSDFYQQPPFGFHSYIYCAEIRTCKILFDPDGLISNLKAEVKEYPQALKQTIIRDFLWDAEFSLMHGKKSAQRGEVTIVAGCLTKIASDFIQVLYALNEEFFISDKKFYKQENTFQIKPARFLNRITRVLGSIGESAESLDKTIIEADRLFTDFVELAGDLYQPEFNIKLLAEEF